MERNENSRKLPFNNTSKKMKILRFMQIAYRKKSDI